MKSLGIILLSLFMSFCVLAPILCLVSNCNRKSRDASNPKPRQLRRARRQLKTVTVRSSGRSRNSKTSAGNIVEAAMTTMGETGECSICICPLISEPAPVATPKGPPRVSVEPIDNAAAGGPAEAPPLQATVSKDSDKGDVLTLNTCGHAFHSRCLSSWFLIYRYDCPVCRSQYYTVHGSVKEKPREGSEYWTPRDVHGV